MKRMILFLVAVGLLLSLCACAEKKTEINTPETTDVPETTEASQVLPDGDKTPMEGIQNPIRANPTEDEKEFDTEPLPTLTWTEIPDPEPVEPESANS